jgi:hypothetical protein
MRHRQEHDLEFIQERKETEAQEREQRRRVEGEQTIQYRGTTIGVLSVRTWARTVSGVGPQQT